MMFLTAVTLLLTIGGISAQCLTGNDSPIMMDPASKMSLLNARSAFALDSLKKTALIESSDNLFFSPHSLYQAITLAYFGARGTTENALKNALRIPDTLSKVDVQHYYGYEAFNNLRDAQMNASDNYEYKSANRLWVTDTRKVRECMLDFFGDQLEMTDFRTNPVVVRDRINNWVSNMTKGHIRDLLPPNSISEDTDLVLVNAVYFKGLWAHRFDPKNSKRDAFYGVSRNSIVTYMRQKGNFNHVASEELGAHILELPYKGNDIAMYVLLPPLPTLNSESSGDGAPRDAIRHLVERLTTEKGSREIREMLDYGLPMREVEVSLPRFEMEKELPVGQLLSALGAGELLTPNADLRGFVEDGERGLHLGDAVHRARIEVTEEGTTAAAATALLSFRSSRPTEPAVFNANHPFVYMIYDRPNQAILFVGVFRAPPPI